MMQSTSSFKGKSSAETYRALKSGPTAIINLDADIDGGVIVLCEPIHVKILTFFSKRLDTQIANAKTGEIHGHSGLVKDTPENQQVILNLPPTHKREAYIVAFRWMSMSVAGGTNAQLSNISKDFTYMQYCRIGEVAIYLDMEILRKQARDAMLTIAANQIPVEQVKLVYQHLPPNDFARRLVAQSIGKAQIQHRLLNADAYEVYGKANPKFAEELATWKGRVKGALLRRMEEEGRAMAATQARSAPPTPVNTLKASSTALPAASSRALLWAEMVEMEEEDNGTEPEQERDEKEKFEQDDGFTLVVNKKKKGKKIG